MAIDRQAVQGLAMVQSQGGPRAATVQSRVAGAPTVSTKTSLLDDLLSVAGGAAQVATEVMNNTVEEDKIRQYDRNLRGLLPSDDATVGGRRAHMLVNLQNRTNETTLRLQDDAKRFQGTDDEWEDHVILSQRQMREEVGLNYPELVGDKETGKIMTNAFMEQQPQIFAARAGAKLQQEATERVTSLQSRVHSLTEGLSGEDLSGMLHNLQREAVAMQITKPEYEAMIAGIAMERAAIGDTGFIEATKDLKDANGVSLYQREGKLQQASIQGLRMKASLNQAGLSAMKFDLEEKFLGGGLSEAEFLQQAHSQNQQTGGSAWSDEGINALRRQKAKASGEAGKITDSIMRISKGQLMGIDNYSEKELKSIEGGLMAQASAEAEAFIKVNGLDGEQADQVRRKANADASTMLAKAGIKDSIMTRQIDNFMLITPEHLQSMDAEPAEMEALLSKWESLPEQYRGQIVGDKQAAFVTNYQRGLELNMNPGQALDFAQKASKERKFSSAEFKDMNKRALSAAKNVATSSGWTPFDNFPDHIRAQMERVAGDYMRDFLTAGYSPDDAEKQVSLALDREYAQVGDGVFSGGTVIRGGVDKLAQRLNVNQQDLGAQFQSYLQVNKDDLEDTAGGAGVEEMYFDIDQKRGVFMVRAGASGMPVGSPRALSELGDYKWAEKASQLDEAQKKEMQGRIQESLGLSGENAVTAEKVGGVVFGTLMNVLFPEAKASDDQLPNLEVGTQQKNSDFVDFVANAENGVGVGFDSRAGVYTPYKDAHGHSVGFGHFLTPEEKRNGYIMIGDSPVPYRPGESQLTKQQARTLLEQDLKSHIPSTEGWDVPFDQMHPTAQRALTDTAYNLGKGFLKESPKAAAAFKRGDLQSGFVHMLSTMNVEGKRSPAILARRAHAYNLSAGNNFPRITEMDNSEDGTMRVKFSANAMNGYFGKEIAKDVGEDGWYTVIGSKKGSMQKGAKLGITTL